jgi:hypothetical protein
MLTSSAARRDIEEAFDPLAVRAYRERRQRGDRRPFYFRRLNMPEDKKSYYAVIPANVRYDKRLKPNAKLLYGEITALCNDKGYCWATNNYFSELYEVAKETISGWIKQLSVYGYIKIDLIYKEGTKEIINRYLRIIGYPINEKVNTPINENVKGNITSSNTTFNTTNNTPPTAESKKPKQEYSDTFLTFWDSYPKKDGKKIAYRAWNAETKRGAKPEDIIYCLDRYKTYLKNHGTQEQYIKNPSTFINNFEDWRTLDVKPIEPEKKKNWMDEVIQGMKDKGEI